VRLYTYFAGAPDARTFVSVPHFHAYRSDLATFDALAALATYSQSGADIGSNERAERIRTLPVSADYFRVVGVDPFLGRAFERTEEIDAPVVILSYDLWQRLFHGRADAVGASLTMSGMPRTICGVMPRGFTDPLIAGVDAWVPIDIRPVNSAQNPMNHFLTVVGRLRPGVTRERAQLELDALGVSLVQQFPDAKNTRAILVPLKDDLVGSASRTLELMLGAVGLVLLLACVNVANLLLVRASERSRELALRAARAARTLGTVERRMLGPLHGSAVGHEARQTVPGRVARPADPTSLPDPTQARIAGQVNGPVRKVEAWVPLGLVDQLWWITDFTKDRGPATLGVHVNVFSHLPGDFIQRHSTQLVEIQIQRRFDYHCRQRLHAQDTLLHLRESREVCALESEDR